MRLIINIKGVHLLFDYIVWIYLLCNDLDLVDYKNNH